MLDPTPPTEGFSKEDAGGAAGPAAAGYPPRPILRIRTPPIEDDYDLEFGGQVRLPHIQYFSATNAYGFTAQQRREIADMYVGLVGLCILPVLMAYFREIPLHLLWLLLTLPRCLRAHLILFSP